jgi:transcriptional regulator with XRE-family HTH domain
MTGENIGNTAQRVAAELKRVREAAGLSQEQMAERLGMGYAPGGRKVSTGRATVSLWERGRRPPPQQHLRAYLNLGGDPAVLAPSPDSPPAACSAARTAPGPADGPGPVGAFPARPAAPGPLAGLGARWPWLMLPVAVAAIAAAAFFVARSGNGPSGPASTWTETTGTPAHTWADPVQLTGAGTPLGPRQSVQVLCRVRGYVVQDGDPWWYRLASTPWNGRYYATSDAFYNNGATSGSVDTGVVVDEQVPVCPGSQG